jgi:biopolymer transport protein TolQ
MIDLGMNLLEPHLAVTTPKVILGVFSGGVWDILAQTSFFGSIILAILVIMSFVSWGIMINKYRLFKEVNGQSGRFGSLFTRARHTSDLQGQTKNFRMTPLAAIFAAGVREAEAVLAAKNQSAQNPESHRRLEEHDFNTIALILDKTVAEEMGKLERYVVFLATTANSAPFLGLLGTVARGSASLTVVAPGIAEALLATIVGLAAAIPAVIGYNWANNKLKYISEQAGNFSLELLARLKKDSYE